MREKRLDNRPMLVEHILCGQTDFYRLAFSYVKNREAALDIVQEAVAKALAKADTLREPACLKSWFYRILLNEIRNHFRRNRPVLSLEELPETGMAEGGSVEERMDLYDAIDRLPLLEQGVVRLRFFEDMKLEEIAQCTGTNLSTVKTRLYKALRRLKERTGEEIDHEP